MADRSISWFGVLLRMVCGLVVVIGTWNPTGYSFYHWVVGDVETSMAVKAFLGALLLAAWVMCLRATSSSLGTVGFILCAAVLGTLIWMLTDFGILHDETPTFVAWSSLVVLGLILGVGLSWSLMRQRATGVVETD
ncbi:MAG TPA: DUF6524 family protein [Myxococcota bacterium]|nr:DUF6524 family protein [Myxococcota bacterium]